MTAFVDLSDAVVTVLTAALPAVPVRRGRRLSIPQGMALAIEVHVERADGGGQFEQDTVTAWKSLIGIDCIARADAGTDGEQAVDDLLGDVFSAMAGASVPDGTASWVFQPAVRWGIVEADQTLCVASLSLAVTHFTGPSSLAAYH